MALAMVFGVMPALGLTARAATPTYTVSGYPSDNGTVTTDKTTVEAGVTVTLTVTPADGYQLSAIWINNTKDATVIGKTEVSFAMPAEDVDISANFEEGIVVYFDNSETKWTNVSVSRGMGIPI